MKIDSKVIKKDLSNLQDVFPDDFTDEQTAKARTIFLKKLSVDAHKFYGGKIQTVPKAAISGFNWFNVWYTPGVSGISTSIRDNNTTSFELTGRGNTVAVVSDSTRVLGDGDCTPPGGMGVMEGKAMLMKHLGGVDAVPLCIDAKDDSGESNPQKIIDFVKMATPSFGAVNLEDISQPNCYEVLETLRRECDIPVWHDDAQGTACVTLAGLLNALKIAEKQISEVKIVLLGAGAANSSIFRFIEKAGGNPRNIYVFDIDGGLHKNRKDILENPRLPLQRDICLKSNPECEDKFENAARGADVLIALSKPGPGVIAPSVIESMARKSVVFACANPVPEIYPESAKKAGAFIVATGRGDFPNQVNNSLGFPGILKGALLVRAKKITDNMAIAAAKSLADFAEKRGISPDNIIPTMDETEVFPVEAADVAIQAARDGVARVEMSREEVYKRAKADIERSRHITDLLTEEGLIELPPEQMLQDALRFAVEAVRGQ